MTAGTLVLRNAVRTAGDQHSGANGLSGGKIMRVNRTTGIYATLIVLLAACGGGGDTTSPSGGNQNPGGSTGTSQMTATINGQAFAASAIGGVVAAQIDATSGGYLVAGLEITGAGRAITFTLNGISGPGTYPLGVDGVSVAGGFGSVTVNSSNLWNTGLTGGSGTITITSLTTKHIAGSFTFTASAASGTATGTQSVTNGSFDAAFSKDAVIKTLADSIGSKMTATLAGTAWNAAIGSGQTASGYFSISGINDRQTLIFTLPLPTATGTFAMSNASGNILQAWDSKSVRPAGARCCWGVVGDVGSITITSLTKTRTKGTFSATLSPQPGTAATGQLTITNGTFDIGLFHTP